jgi:hypothetical protein
VKAIPPPRELSAKSRAKWSLLTREYEFETHELEVLAQCLLAADRAADFATKRLFDLSYKESGLSLKWWRALKFPSPAVSRRIGRPPDQQWSAIRRGGEGAAT